MFLRKIYKVLHELAPTFSSLRHTSPPSHIRYFNNNNYSNFIIEISRKRRRRGQKGGERGEGGKKRISMNIAYV